MDKKKKEPKKRAEKFEEKLSIYGTLEDVLKVSVPSSKKVKKE